MHTIHVIAMTSILKDEFSSVTDSGAKPSCTQSKEIDTLSSWLIWMISGLTFISLNFTREVYSENT